MSEFTTYIYDDHTDTFQGDTWISSRYTVDKRSKPYSIFTEDGQKYGNSKFFGGALFLALGWLMLFTVLFALSDPSQINSFAWLETSLRSIADSKLNGSADKLLEAIKNLSNLESVGISVIGDFFMLPVYFLGCMLSVFDTLFRLVFPIL